MERDEVQDSINEHLNVYQDLASQVSDCDVKHDAGVIEDETYCEQAAIRRACAIAVHSLKAGEDVGDDEYEALLAESREVVSKPTALDDARADIDYLLMVGGEL